MKKRINDFFMSPCGFVVLLGLGIYASFALLLVLCCISKGYPLSCIL